MIRFSTENLRKVFADENKFQEFRSVASNLVRGNQVYAYDEDGNERKVSNRQANAAIQKVFMEVCGLTKEDLNSPKRVRRAVKAHGMELFEIIEEDIEWKINDSWATSEWFEQFVDRKSHALGDANSFYVEEKQYLIVGDVSGDHHDVTIQQLGAGEEFAVKCTNHAIKIGKDIDLIVLGRFDYSKMVQKVADAFVKDITDTVFADVYGAAESLPSELKMTTDLTAGTKADFDALIERVQIINDSDVVLMGTKTALKKLNALADVDWATVEQKESMAKTGRLGTYEGTTLVEVPQRLKIGSLTETLLPNDVILIMPVNEEKFVKFYEEGETEIFEINEKAQLKDDFQTYEVHRAYGAEVVLGQYFGVWDKA